MPAEITLPILVYGSKLGLKDLVGKLEYLSKGIAIILAFIGVKLLFHALHETTSLPVPEIPIWLSLTVIIGVIFLAFLLWDAAGAAMDHRLETAPPAKRNKLRTIFPLVKRVILLVLAVMVGFTLLSEFGVNIAPLLASAGIVGLAVGFGAQTLVVSNACGGMHPLWAPGDIMMIADHINLLGDSPLIGANDERFGPRFPDLSACYDAALRALAREVAVAHRVTLREGTYVAVPGPNLETRAEYRMLRQFGADVVGMSTVPEVIVAVHGGMRVLGLSIITDQCLPDALVPATLEQIMAVAAKAEPVLTTLVTGVLEKLPA